MKELTLALKSQRVESFAPADEPQPSRGTVHGQDNETAYSWYDPSCADDLCTCPAWGDQGCGLPTDCVG